jgi:hypothetical protein
LTISIRSRGAFATAVVNLPGIVAAIGPDRFEPREALADLAEGQPGPVAVPDRGGVYDYPIGIPSLSTRAWILRPFTCLPAS